MSGTKSRSTKTGLLTQTDKNLPEGAPFLFLFARTGKAVFLFCDESPAILPCRGFHTDTVISNEKLRKEGKRMRKEEIEMELAKHTDTIFLER